jgi:hypothetical protein
LIICYYFKNEKEGNKMNIAQRLILLLGLTIVIPIIIVPYRVTVYKDTVWDGRTNDDMIKEASRKDWIAVTERIEFHNIFTPPLSKTAVYDGSNYGWQDIYRIVYRERDYILQGSIMLGELSVLTVLFFLFKLRSKKEAVQ